MFTCSLLHLGPTLLFIEVNTFSMVFFKRRRSGETKHTLVRRENQTCISNVLLVSIDALINILQDVTEPFQITPNAVNANAPAATNFLPLCLEILPFNVRHSCQNVQVRPTTLLHFQHFQIEESTKLLVNPRSQLCPQSVDAVKLLFQAIEFSRIQSQIDFGLERYKVKESKLLLYHFSIRFLDAIAHSYEEPFFFTLVFQLRVLAYSVMILPLDKISSKRPKFPSGSDMWLSMKLPSKRACAS